MRNIPEIPGAILAEEARERLIRIAESEDAAAGERSAALHQIAHSYINEGKASFLPSGSPPAWRWKTVFPSTAGAPDSTRR